MIDKGFGLVKLKLEDWNIGGFGEILSKNAQAVYCIVLYCLLRKEVKLGVENTHTLYHSLHCKKKGRKKAHTPSHAPTHPLTLRRVENQLTFRSLWSVCFYSALEVSARPLSFSRSLGG